MNNHLKDNIYYYFFFFLFMDKIMAQAHQLHKRSLLGFSAYWAARPTSTFHSSSTYHLKLAMNSDILFPSTSVWIRKSYSGFPLFLSFMPTIKRNLQACGLTVQIDQREPRPQFPNNYTSNSDESWGTRFDNVWTGMKWSIMNRLYIMVSFNCVVSFDRSIVLVILITRVPGFHNS